MYIDLSYIRLSEFFTYLSIVNEIVRNPQTKNANGMMMIDAIRYIHFIVVSSELDVESIAHTKRNVNSEINK